MNSPLHVGLREADEATGDEFAVLLEGLTDGAPAARRVADKILTALAAPFALEGGEAHIGASIGFAIHAPGAESSADGLLKEADAWMYAAKRAGKGAVFPQPDFPQPNSPRAGPGAGTHPPR